MGAPAGERYTQKMDALLPVFLRWLHIASMAVLLGGVFYAVAIAGDLAPGFKRVAYTAIGGILLSGIVNFLRRSSFPPHYHAWFGIKILLALHIFAAILMYRGKRRALTGVLVSGSLVLVISAYLRFLSIS